MYGSLQPLVHGWYITMKQKKVLYINIDGFSFSYFEQLTEKEPNGSFSRLAREGMLFADLHSGLVSITNPMQGAILCGAWSNRTHNFYQHYDWETGTIVKHKRTCDAENIAQLFRRCGKTAVSIHQFMLENNPCTEGNRDCLYVRCPNEKSNSFQRLDILRELILGNPVYSGGRAFTYSELPDFTAVYLDDIDSLGHNNAYEQYPIRHEFSQRQADIQERLSQIGEKLLEIVNLCKAKELLEDLTILITTDHGMTPFFGKSQLPALQKALRDAGIQADHPQERSAQTRVVLLPYTIEVSLYCAPDLTGEDRKVISQVCRNFPCVERVFEKEQMQSEFGFDLRGPDFLLAPQYGSHFYHRDISADTFAASHDSFHETSQHIFGLLIGNGAQKGSRYMERAYAIDLLPTILSDNFGLKMKDQTGKIHDFRRAVK